MICASIEDIFFVLAIFIISFVFAGVHQRHATRKQPADLGCLESHIFLIQAEGTENGFLPLGHCMIKAVCTIVPPDHLDLLEFPDGLGNRHVVRPGLDPEQFLLQEGVDPVAYDEGDKLDEDFGGEGVLGLDPHASSSQEGLV